MESSFTLLAQSTKVDLRQGYGTVLGGSPGLTGKPTMVSGVLATNTGSECGKGAKVTPTSGSGSKTKPRGLEYSFIRTETSTRESSNEAKSQATVPKGMSTVTLSWVSS
jgi:hypothetical protein